MDEKLMSSLVTELAKMALAILRRVNGPEEAIVVNKAGNAKQPLNEQELCVVMAAEGAVEKLVELEIERLRLGIKG